MSESSRGRTGVLVVAVVLGSVAMAGGVYWAVHDSGPDLEDDLGSGNVDRMRSALLAVDTETFKGEQARERRRLTVETMRQMPVKDLMALWQGEDLTEEERELLGNNMRTIWMEHMNEMADEYFAASDEDKVAILDRRIDEFTEFGNRMREYRESRQEEEEEEDEEERERRREEMRRRWRSPSKEERKERMVETNPDQQAKMFYMFTKMRERAQERGIDMGWGRGGGDSGQGGRRDGDSRRDRDRENGRDRDGGDRRGD